MVLFKVLSHFEHLNSMKYARQIQAFSFFRQGKFELQRCQTASPGEEDHLGESGTKRRVQFSYLTLTHSCGRIWGKGKQTRAKETWAEPQLKMSHKYHKEKPPTLAKDRPPL